MFAYFWSVLLHYGIKRKGRKSVAKSVCVSNKNPLVNIPWFHFVCELLFPVRIRCSLYGLASMKCNTLPTLFRLSFRCDCVFSIFSTDFLHALTRGFIKMKATWLLVMVQATLMVFGTSEKRE